jgi:hypothetical protein
VHVVSDMFGFEGCRNQEVAVALMEGDNSAGVGPSSADASRDRDNLVSPALPCLALSVLRYTHLTKPMLSLLELNLCEHTIHHNRILAIRILAEFLRRRDVCRISLK